MDLIEALGLDQPDILGWSLGGFIALTTLVNYPDAVNRLVVSDTSPGGIDGLQTLLCPSCLALACYGKPQRQRDTQTQKTCIKDKNSKTQQCLSLGVD